MRLYDESRYQHYINVNDLIEGFNKASMKTKERDDMIKEQGKVIDSLPKVSIRGLYYGIEEEMNKKISHLEQRLDECRKEKSAADIQVVELESKVEKLEDEVKYLRDLNNRYCEAVARGKQDE